MCHGQRMSRFWFLIFVYFLRVVRGNVEKTIFIAPEVSLQLHDASIDNLLLEPIHPHRLSVQTHVNASFPKPPKNGEDSWSLLAGLNPGQRYEVRICWLATQPTAFRLDTYTIGKAFETPDLITSLSTYAYARHDVLSESDIRALRDNAYRPGDSKAETSMLFLRVQAAADYFSLNKTLMENVPPVHVDIILDPYLFNVFPQSLVPTAGYVVMIAVAAWFLAGWVQRQLMAYLKSDDSSTKPQPEAETKKLK